MSPAPQPLQERILDVLAENAPVRARELRNWLPGYDLGAIDYSVKGLIKANKVSLTFGSYDLVKSGSPPSASEEAIASLTPPDSLQQLCEDCCLAKPLNEFQLTGHGNRRIKVCRGCMGKRSLRARGKELQGPQGKPALTHADGLPATSEVVDVAPQGIATESPALNSQLPTAAKANGATEGRDFAETPRTVLAGDRATPSTEDSLRLLGESSGPDRLPPSYTPALPPGSPEPPAISSEHLVSASAHGTQPAEVALTNPEALSPVSLSTPAMLAQLAQKRARCVRERAALGVVIDRLDGLVLALQRLGERG